MTLIISQLSNGLQARPVNPSTGGLFHSEVIPGPHRWSSLSQHATTTDFKCFKGNERLCPASLLLPCFSGQIKTKRFILLRSLCFPVIWTQGVSGDNGSFVPAAALQTCERAAAALTAGHCA